MSNGQMQLPNSSDEENHGLNRDSSPKSRIWKFLTKWGVEGGVLIAILAAFIFIGRGLQKVDNLVEKTNKLDLQITSINEIMGGPDGISSLNASIDLLMKQSQQLECKITASHVNLWFRDFEIQLWQYPIDKLTNPGFNVYRQLCHQINEFKESLELCQGGKELAKRLVGLRDGLSAFRVGDYDKAYISFTRMDSNRSLTHRFLGAAKSQHADQQKNPSMRYTADQHLRNAYDLARLELTTSIQQEVVDVMHCNAYSPESEADEAIKCWGDLAAKGIHPSFAYVAIASLYARLDQCEKAIENLNKFVNEPFKELDRDALIGDVDLLKLKNSRCSADFANIIKHPSISP